MTGGGDPVGPPPHPRSDPVHGAETVGPGTAPDAGLERVLLQITEVVAASSLERIISPSLTDFLA